MKNINKIFLILSFLFALFLPACSGSSKPIYILPTNYGMKCMNNGYLKKTKKGFFIENGVKYKASDAYEMIIYSTPELKAHVPNIPYSDMDIDVQLFGIGTNEYNYPEADTLLYASTNKNGNDFLDAGKKLVTGVEYVYQTGPISKELLSSRQELWIKTTIMEESNGYYVESKKYIPTFTQVFVTIIDGIPPVSLQDSEFDVSVDFIKENNSSEETLKEKLSELLKEKIVKRYEYYNQFYDFDGGTICSDVRNIRFINFNSQSYIYNGFVDLYDKEENCTKDQAFSMRVTLVDEDNNYSDDRFYIPSPNSLPIVQCGYNKSIEEIEFLLKMHLNISNNSNYKLQINSNNLVFYDNSNIEVIRDFVKNKKVQQLICKITYCNEFVFDNILLGKLILVDDVGPTVKTTYSQEKFANDTKKLCSGIKETFDDLYQFITPLIGKIESTDEIYENNFYFIMYLNSWYDNSTMTNYLNLDIRIIDEQRNSSRMSYEIRSLKISDNLMNRITSLLDSNFVFDSNGKKVNIYN